MKRIIIPFILIVSLLSSTHASADVLSWGITGGINISKINFKEKAVQDIAKPDAKGGWYVGMMGIVSLPVLGFGIDGAITYSQEKVNAASDMEDETAKFISVPLHLRYDFKLPIVEKVVVPVILAGPQFNYATNDLKLAYKDGTDAGAVIKKTNSWRMDLGLGATLFNHVQLTYSYGIPMGTHKIEGVDDVESTYKLGAHRIGLAILF